MLVVLGVGEVGGGSTAVIVVAGVVVLRIRGRARSIGGRADAKELEEAVGVRIDSHFPAPLTLSHNK